MVMLMHCTAVAVLEAHGPEDVRRAIGSGEHSSTRKSWVTAAGHADSYVWSSRPLAGRGAMTLWLVADLATKVCGGGAFRKELAIERSFRYARAARVMAPTTDALLDFIGRALVGMPRSEAS